MKEKILLASVLALSACGSDKTKFVDLVDCVDGPQSAAGSFTLPNSEKRVFRNKLEDGSKLNLTIVPRGDGGVDFSPSQTIRVVDLRPMVIEGDGIVIEFASQAENAENTRLEISARCEDEV